MSENSENTPEKAPAKKRASRSNTSKNNSLTNSNSKTMATTAAPSKKTSLFTQLINSSDSNLLLKRADLIARSTQEELEMQIMEAKRSRNDIEFSIAKNEDLGKTDSTSLVVGGDFNPSEWVATMFKLEQELLDLNIQITILENLQTKYFG